MNQGNDNSLAIDKTFFSKIYIDRKRIKTIKASTFRYLPSDSRRRSSSLINHNEDHCCMMTLSFAPYHINAFVSVVFSCAALTIITLLCFWQQDFKHKSLYLFWYLCYTVSNYMVTKNKYSKHPEQQNALLHFVSFLPKVK